MNRLLCSCLQYSRGIKCTASAPPGRGWSGHFLFGGERMIPGLTFDAATHTFRAGDGRLVPSVTQTLQAAGLNCRPPGVSDAQWEAAAELGTRVHQWCRYGPEPGEPIPEQVAPYFAAWEAFAGAVTVTIEAHETIVSAADYWYAGIVDILAFVSGSPAVIDIKTSDPQPWHALQTAAYARAAPRHNRKRYGLYLRDNGTYKFIEHTDRRDFDVFAAALTLNAWRQSV